MNKWYFHLEAKTSRYLLKEQTTRMNAWAHRQKIAVAVAVVRVKRTHM